MITVVSSIHGFVRQNFSQGTRELLELIATSMGFDYSNPLFDYDFSDGIFIFRILDEDERTVSIGTVNDRNVFEAIETVNITDRVRHGGKYYTITEIADDGFSECISLRSITIPDSVTHIGRSSFSYCKSLENITIPKNVTVFFCYNFRGCESLTDIVFRGNNIDIELWDPDIRDNLETITVPHDFDETRIRGSSSADFKIIRQS